MKEMQYRKSNLKDRPELKDVFEVRFFEPSQILDEKTRNIVNEKIADIENKCQKRLQELVIKTKYYEKECSNLKRNLQALTQKNDILTLATSLFLLETNPYKIWKVFQDIKGNKFFFDCFED